MLSSSFSAGMAIANFNGPRAWEEYSIFRLVCSLGMCLLFPWCPTQSALVCHIFVSEWAVVTWLPVTPAIDLAHGRPWEAVRLILRPGKPDAKHFSADRGMLSRSGPIIIWMSA